MLFQTWTFAVFFLIFHTVHLLLGKTRARTPWLVLSLLNGLGMLAFFKYRFFFVANLNWPLAQLRTTYTIPPRI